jgi:hypothetical protein
MSQRSAPYNRIFGLGDMMPTGGSLDKRFSTHKLQATCVTWWAWGMSIGQNGEPHTRTPWRCGNMGDETELDMSGKMSGAGDAVMLAAEVIDNVALLQLNVADNNINNGGRGMDHIGPAIAASTSITSLNIASNFIGMNGGSV